MAEQWPDMHKTLGSIPSTSGKEKKEEFGFQNSSVKRIVVQIWSHNSYFTGKRL